MQGMFCLSVESSSHHIFAKLKDKSVVTYLVGSGECVTESCETVNGPTYLPGSGEYVTHTHDSMSHSLKTVVTYLVGSGECVTLRVSRR